MPTRSRAIASGTGYEPRRAAVRLGCLTAAATLLAGAWTVAAAAEPERARIYRCDVDGKKVTRDRPIAECSNRVQYLLNADGSVNRAIPPSMTVEERERKEQADLLEEQRQVQLKQLVRADRSLMLLYPNEAAHKKARDNALDEFRTSVRGLEASIALLVTERKKLLDEAEFYPKGLPAKLKASIEANEVTLKAKRDLVEKQQSEVVRITNNFEVELARLRKLWAGAQPGSLGPLPGTQQAVATSATAPAAITAQTPDSATKTTVK